MHTENSARDHVKNAAFWPHPHRPCYSGFRVKPRDLHSSVSKSSACNAEDLGLIPGSGRSPGEGNGNPLQYSCLEKLMDRGAWQTIVSGVTRVGHDLATKPPPIIKWKKSGKNNLPAWIPLLLIITNQIINLMETLTCVSDA